MIKLYNSLAEMKSRVLLILENSIIGSMNFDMIVAIDFITIYGKEFGISDYNLHGDNQYKYSELPSRRADCWAAIKSLVKEGLIDVETVDGYKYSISDIGYEFISKFECDYILEYSQIVNKTFEKYGHLGENELLKLIQRKSKISNREDISYDIH